MPTAMYTYKARVEEPGNGVITSKIEAAYFKEEGRFVVFKDADNKAVYAVRSECLLHVERVTESLAAETAHRG